MRALFLVAGLAWGAIIVAPGAKRADEASKATCDSSSEPERSSLQIPARVGKLVVRSSAVRPPPLARAPLAGAAARSPSRLQRPAAAASRPRPGEPLVATAAPRGPPRARA